jgi:AcrR family transcriptional regulator
VKQERARERRRNIVAAATRLFGKQGIARTSLTDIARLSGVPLPSLYDYFKDKDDLVAAVPEENYLALYAQLAAERPASRAHSSVRSTSATWSTFAPIPIGAGYFSSRSGRAWRSGKHVSAAPSTVMGCATSN